MKVRIRRRLWVVLMVDRKTGTSIPRWNYTRLDEARRAAINMNLEGFGYWACVVPFRYDELAFAKRRARRRARKASKTFKQEEMTQ